MQPLTIQMAPFVAVILHRVWAEQPESTSKGQLRSAYNCAQMNKARTPLLRLHHARREGGGIKCRIRPLFCQLFVFELCIRVDAHVSENHWPDYRRLFSRLVRKQNIATKSLGGFDGHERFSAWSGYMGSVTCDWTNRKQVQTQTRFANGQETDDICEWEGNRQSLWNEY